MSWGFGGVAKTLSNTLKAIFPMHKVEMKAAKGLTNRIDVIWISGDQKKTIWA